MTAAAAFDWDTVVVAAVSAVGVVLAAGIPALIAARRANAKSTDNATAISVLADRVASLEDELALVREQLAEAHAETLVLRERIAARDARIGVLEAALTTAQERERALEARVAELEAELARARGQA